MYRLVLLCCLLAASGWLFAAENRSSSLYSEVEKSIFQVRVVNKKTGNKSTIGSGFIVARPTILATNYHVISAYANDPETYAIDYFSTNGDTGRLQLIDVDVLHDLAILKAEAPLGRPLQTARVPEKGAVLYAFGNPLDLGFSIVTGTNNGLMTGSEDNNILFSGSLNSGMSGGPALNQDGKVVGINVATAGNDVSFLVLVEYLNIMLERLKLSDFQPVQDLFGNIIRQLHEHSVEMLNDLQTNEWQKTQIGKFAVPTRLGQYISCWDGSSDAEERGLVNVVSANCANDLDIYLGEKLSIGAIRYQYTWYDSQKMISPRFYRMYELENNSGLGTVGNKDEVSKFNCHTGFTQVASKDFKLTVCRRDYLRYSGLSDVLVTGAMVGEKQQGFIFDLYLTGTDFNNATKLLKKILENFEWTS